MEPQVQYPDLTADLRQGRSWKALKYFGAGAIVASVTIGTGETVFASRGGAVFGYALLWCFLFGAIMKGLQVYSSARYMVLTGEHPMTHWAWMPGPRAWVPIGMAALCLFCFPFWLAALPLMIGTFFNWMFHVGGSEAQLLLYARLWGTLNIVLIVVLTIVHSYGFLERAQTVFVGLMLLCMIVAVLAARPDWMAVLAGMWVPTMPNDYEPWIKEVYPSIASRPPWVEIATYLGAVGGGAYDYLGYISCFREKSWGALGWKKNKYQVATRPAADTLPIDPSLENIRKAKGWLVPVQMDVGIGFVALVLFAGCFIILGAAILHPQRQVPEGNELLNHQAQFLTNLHPALLYVYLVGVFFAIWGTAYGAYELYIRSAFECLSPVSRRIRALPYRTFHLLMLAYLAIGGLVLMWTMDDPIEIATPAALVGGVFACGLWCFAMMWADRRFLPKALQMNRALYYGVATSGVVLTLMGARGIWDYLLRFL